MLTTQRLHERLLKSGLAKESSIHGCNDIELQQIERCAGRKLPANYLDFMASFGKKAGRFMRDIEMFYPDVLQLRHTAIEILQDRDDLDLKLSPEAFVFSSRNKEQFVFFEDEADDPAVMFYMSGDDAVTKLADSFYEFIEAELEHAEYAYDQVRGTPYDLRPE